MVVCWADCREVGRVEREWDSKVRDVNGTRNGTLLSCYATQMVS